MSKLLTMNEAATQLGISTRTLRGHVKMGEIAYIALGHGVKRVRRMFDESDLEAFKERRRRVDPCPSISPKTRRSSTSTSGGQVSDFTALRNARRAAKQRGAKS
jgi:excisionase family DNA binding protein